MSFPIPSEPIAFKEWAFICDALVQGVQTLVLRKGGIHEGKGGFQFKHDGFFLFPTWFHTQDKRLRWVPEAARGAGYSTDPGYDASTLAFPPEETRLTVDVDGYCTLEQVWRVTDWERVAALQELHVWNEEVIRERFVYDEDSCLQVALVRAYALPQRWSFSYEKKYGGCRSWLTLPEAGLPLLAGARPAMDDGEWRAMAAKTKSILER